MVKKSDIKALIKSIEEDNFITATMKQHIIGKINYYVGNGD